MKARCMWTLRLRMAAHAQTSATAARTFSVAFTLGRVEGARPATTISLGPMYRNATMPITAKLNVQAIAVPRRLNKVDMGSISALRCGLAGQGLLLLQQHFQVHHQVAHGIGAGAVVHAADMSALVHQHALRGVDEHFSRRGID